MDVAAVSSYRNTAVVSISPVQKIMQQGISRLGAVGLHEVAGQFSGVSIKDYGGIGGLKTVSIRNMGGTHTAVIYDGISISDAQNGQIDISRFNLDDVSSVSLSIGPEDDIFCGARQLTSAGTLRIESRMPEFSKGRTSVDSRMTFGSFGTYIPYFSLTQGLGSRHALKVSLNGTLSEGNYPFTLQNGKTKTEETRLNSDVRAYGAEAVFHADWLSKGRLKARVNCYDSERGLPGSVVLYTQNAHERLWDRSLISNVMYEVQNDSEWKFHSDAGFTHSYSRHLNTNPIYPHSQDSRYTQNEYSLNTRFLYTPLENLEIAIADDIFVNSLCSNIPECPFPIRFSNISALSAKYEVSSLRITANIVETFVSEYLQKGDSPDDISRFSPMAGISWEFYKGLRLRASFKEGFRVPTFNDLYYARVGNTRLRPETARQFNLGLTAGWTRENCIFDMTADAYYNSIEDKITAIPTMFIWKMQNVGEVAMYGIDLTTSLMWKTSGSLRIHASANYSLQYALDMTDPDSKSYRHQIPYTPRHCANANLSFETDWVDLTYRLSARGKVYSKNQNLTSNEIDGYADHSLSLNRDFLLSGLQGCHLTVSIEALNLTDLNYQIIHYYPMPGRSFRLSLKFRY